MGRASCGQWSPGPSQEASDGLDPTLSDVQLKEERAVKYEGRMN